MRRADTIAIVAAILVGQEDLSDDTSDRMMEAVSMAADLLMTAENAQAEMEKAEEVEP